jgi:hypothetical protein
MASEPRYVAPLVAASLLACGDRATDIAIEELGPESPDVAVGPLHRPGQPCLVCHDGAEARAFSVAGTVYATPDSDALAAGVTVRMIDVLERPFTAITNCNGNFFILPEDFDPKYPLWVSVRAGSLEIPMDSPINGDGSCAGCHGLTPGPESAGRVYASPIAPVETSAEGCP